MSYEYDEYLNEHISNVKKGLEWMRDKLDLHGDAITDAIREAENHDHSKWGVPEYRDYDAYFYGGNRSYQVVMNFNYAWLLHQHKNPHHWQYWVLINDDEVEGTMPLPMPLRYIYEMIADWWTFSWRDNNLMEIFDWYALHKDYILLHKTTRIVVENLLKEMKEKLELNAATEYLEGLDIQHSGIKGQKWGVRNGPPYPLETSKIAEKMFDNAEKKSAQITKDVESAAKKSGGELHGLENKTKTKESIERKLNKKVNEKGISVSEAANEIKDANRYTLISSTKDFVDTYNSFKHELSKKGYSETSCDNYFDKFDRGEVKHKAVQSNFSDKDGYEFEVQFHTPESQKAKDDKLPLYNERRSSGLSESRKLELEKQMEDLALKVPNPIGIEEIKSFDNHLKHSDIDDGPDIYKFGVPEQKKFPMPDADHVRSAIRFFNYVEPKYEEELAKNILARMKEYGMSFEDFGVGDENRFKNYIPKKDTDS